MADAARKPGERPQGGDNRSAAVPDVARRIGRRPQGGYERRAGAGEILPSRRERAVPCCRHNEQTDEEAEQGAEEQDRKR